MRAARSGGTSPVRYRVRTPGDALLPFVHHRAGSQQHIVRLLRPVRGVVQPEVGRVGVAGKGNVILDLKAGVDAEVVPQVAAHAGEFGNQGYPELLQLLLGANP